MPRALIIASNNQAVHYSAYFRSLGFEACYLVLKDQSFERVKPFVHQTVLCQQKMHFWKNITSFNDTPSLDKELAVLKNQLLAINDFSGLEKKSFFKIKNFFVSKEKKLNFSVKTFDQPIEILQEENVVDLKINKNKSIVCELKAEALKSFDYCFFENTSAVQNFLVKMKWPLLVKSHPHNLEWIRFSCSLEGLSLFDDFWFVEDQNYVSLFDNVFFIQKKSSEEVYVWFGVPAHQKNNLEFIEHCKKRAYVMFQQKLPFLKLKFLEKVESNFELFNSQNWTYKHHSMARSFPCFSLYEEKEVFNYFEQIAPEIELFHKKRYKK